MFRDSEMRMSYSVDSGLFWQHFIHASVAIIFLLSTNNAMVSGRKRKVGERAED
jgi:hypothetical protein